MVQVEVSTPKKSSGDRGWMVTFIILAIVIVSSVFYAGGVVPKVDKMFFLSETQGIPAPKDSYASGSGILIDTFRFTTVTPGPVISVPPGAQPITPTPICSQDVAVDFLIDTSKSMQGEKIQQVRNGLVEFGKKLNGNSIVGIQTFAGSAQEVVPIAPFSSNRSIYEQAIINMVPDAIGLGTYTRDGFTLARSKLRAAQQQYPDKQFKLIFLSDGVPETRDFNDTCLENYRQNGNLTGVCAQNCQTVQTGGALSQLKCFAIQQSPNTDPSVATAIKNSGVEIYSIALLDELDTRYNTQLEDLMRTAASPGKFYKTLNPEDLETIYNQIGTQVCN